MGEANNVLNVYMSQSDRIQSVLEYYLKQKLPENWECHAEEGFYTIKNKNEKISYRQRDIVKRVEVGGRGYLIGIENQQSINLIFPWRLLEMDCLAYARQIEEIQQRNIKNGMVYDKEDDFKYRFKKEDRLEPVLNLTLYWGKDKWKEPTTLKEMLDITVLPGTMQKMVQNYKVHIINMRYIPEKALKEMDSDLRYVVGAIKCSGSRSKYEKFILENKDYFSRIPKSAVDVMDVCVGIKEIKKYLKYIQSSGVEEETDMCRALEEIKMESERKGIKQGVKQGVGQVIRVLIKTCAELGLSKEKTVEKIKKEFSMSGKLATQYVEQYWCS